MSGEPPHYASVSYDRTSPADFYRQIGWLRDEWLSADEPEVTRKLQRLRDLCDHLPGRYYEQTKPLIAALGRCRLQRVSPWQARLVDLCDVIRAWDGERTMRNA